jgi:hypothetical protein
VGYKRRILGNEYGINHHNIENSLRNTWELGEHTKNIIGSLVRTHWVEHEYGIPNAPVFCQVHVFLFVNSTLAKCKVDIAQFSS